MDAEMLESVLTNSGTIMVGNYRGQSVELLARTVDVPAETIRGLKTGQFVVYQREASPSVAVVRMPTNTLKNRAAMAAEDWKRVLSEQVGTYYRQPGKAPEARPEPASPATPEEPAPATRDPDDPLRMDIDSLLN